MIYLWLQSFQSKKKKMCKPLSRFPNHRQEETFDAMQQRFSYVFPSLSLSLAKVRMNPAVVTDPAEWSSELPVQGAKEKRQFKVIT